MKAPAPTWETDYQHDRRAHAHRCHCCKRILATGERVLMAKVASKKTRAIHLECSRLQHGTAAWTWADAMAAWGTDYLIACGWRIPRVAEPLPQAA